MLCNMSNVMMNAVEVSDVSFKYHKVNVLQNIYASVPKGTIYGLLGPSGSGKTTLLRIMLGRIQENSGSISVFGSKPGYFNRIIGYMPQQNALSPELTINETMNYFASLYQLEKGQFESQKQTLQKVLCLPSENQVVATLSGGQQKALSLALVFLHSPSLVILDEPTVGTDPLLGDQIWSYLRSNCGQGLTVILVTHYLIEAGLAHNVGMMRNGRLIEEGTPESLYAKYAENNLETIFIKICTDKSLLKETSQRAQSYQKNIANFLTYDANQNPVDSLEKINSTLMEEDHSRLVSSASYSIIWLLLILVRRNFQKFLSSKLTTIMLFSPIFCTLLMCITFKVDKIMLPTVVFNQDLGHPYSIRMQKLAKSFQVHHIDYKQVHSLNDAISAVERGQAVAALWFERDFSSALTQRAMASIIQKRAPEYDEELEEDMEIFNSTEGTHENSEPLISITLTASEAANSGITTFADIEMAKEASTLPPMETSTFSLSEFPNSRNKSSQDHRRLKRSGKKEEWTKESEHEEDEEEEDGGGEEEEEEEGVSGNFVRLSNKTMRASTIKVFIDNSNIFYAQPLMDMLNFASWELMNSVVGDNGEVTLASPVVVQEVVHAKGTETPDFLLSGYMVAFLYLSQVTLSSQLLIQERKDGFFDRAIVAGAKHSLMFFSHFITNFLFSIFQIILMFLVGFVWYSVPNFGSYWLCFLLALLQSASSIMTGLLISATCRENFSAFFVALSITLSQLFTSGAVFPIVSFDPLISFILNITPISMPVESLRNVMLRGYDLTYFRVAHGLITNIVTTLAFGLLALYFFIKHS